jgi:SAM-dependent methyltransferase
VLALLLSLIASHFSFSPVQAPARTPDVHFTPTRHAIADAMLQLANVGPGDVVYDLGSGDGRIPIIAAQKYGARGVGIEIDPALVAQARRNAEDAGVADRVTFIVGDLFKADLREATVVTMYLSPNILKQLEPGLRALRPGTRIVSHQFPMGTWTPDRRMTVDEAELLLWIVPAPDASDRERRRMPGTTPPSPGTGCSWGSGSSWNTEGFRPQAPGFGHRFTSSRSTKLPWSLDNSPSGTCSPHHEIIRWESSSTPFRCPASSRSAT